MQSGKCAPSSSRIWLAPPWPSRQEGDTERYDQASKARPHAFQAAHRIMEPSKVALQPQLTIFRLPDERLLAAVAASAGAGRGPSRDTLGRRSGTTPARA